MVKEKHIVEAAEEQIYAQRKNVRYDIRDLTVEIISSKFIETKEDYIDRNKSASCIYVPEYQRDFTWDEKRQSKLIESIILGLPIPFIFVAENKDSSWEIVDGSQRIRTIDAFVKGQLCLTGLESLTKLNNFTINDLDEGRKGKVLNTAIRIIVLTEETSENAKKDMFERINRGSDLLKPQEKRKGIYPGKFNDFIYKYCATNKEFKNLVLIDRWLEKRQEREELLLRFFALSENNAYRNGLERGIASFLDDYLDKMNQYLDRCSEQKQKEILDSYTDKINNVVEFVGKNFPYGFRAVHNPQTKRSIFEAISVGVYIAQTSGKKIVSIDKEYIAKKLKSQDFREVTYGANQLHGKSKLSRRIEYIAKMLMGE